ncbi:MAG: adenylate/guanylate cyclase domain-containing protein [Deltaproteobacteria bacterium]
MPSFLGLYIRNLGANLLGFVVIALLNSFTPLEFFRIQRDYIFTQGGWKVFFLFSPLATFLVILLQYRVQFPISRFLRHEPSDPIRASEMREKAQRRLLNLPFILAFTNLAVYILAPGFMVLSFYFFRGIEPKTCLFIYFRAIMIGLIAASLSFFLIEDCSRRTLVPVLFPKGRLATIPGTLKTPIARRIRALYGAGTLNPMILLVSTLVFTALEERKAAVPVEFFVREMLVFTLILCGVFVILAFGLNSLVQNSIRNPIREMLAIVEKVKNGDFSQRIKVLSNDEIGMLGDAGNAMVAGLAEREQIRDTFGKYVTPQIRDQILSGRIPLHGERQIATLLFSDLRDFTTYVEANDPEEVIKSMREYFTAMQTAIRNHDGLVLQYVGDEIEAVFGVPLKTGDHADRAVRAALDMRKNLEELNKKRLLLGKTPFRHGIGIHTGDVLAGNTGSEDRLSYALIGDTVNLASRIEGLTKAFQWDILISNETSLRLSGSFELKQETPQNVKGFSKPIIVHKIL